MRGGGEEEEEEHTARGKIKFVIFHTTASHLRDGGRLRDSIWPAQRENSGITAGGIGVSISRKQHSRHLRDLTAVQRRPIGLAVA